PGGDTPRQIGTQFGALLYQHYCESCHGESGRGDGPEAATLPIPPADLGRLAAENGGRYPADRVAAAIDGRGGNVAHLELGLPPLAQRLARELQGFDRRVLEALLARRIAHL